MTIVIPENLNFALKATAARERRYIQYIAAELFAEYLKKKHPDIYEEFGIEKSIEHYMRNMNR